MGYSRSGADVTRAPAGSARVAATTASMSAATTMSTAAGMPSTTAAGMPSTTAAAVTTSAAGFISCVARARQCSGKNEDDNSEPESRHDVPQSIRHFWNLNSMLLDWGG